ncbi:6264_t:CDS:2 [Funneliformis geosporum]|uniref:6264_t:CDS:1 n=1 Tax=Funneliformis geosporum TaxID=1117311 RepID=A0A9W4STJ2_9GLOM|nr:6264_t:CDS:2 [Funneliformis geosporum]
MELDKILVRDIGRLYEDSDDCNVQIQVGHGSNVRIFKAHSVILRARSSYFRAALSSNWARKDGDYMILHQPNISPVVFEIILKYIYTGTIVMDDMNIRVNYTCLLAAADELAIIELIDHIQDHIIKNDAALLRRKLVEFLTMTAKHEACNKLHKYCEGIICDDPVRFFSLEEFGFLDKSNLIDILKKELFNIKEIEIWNNVVKWGMAQHQKFPSDNSKWQPLDFIMLRDTLQDCIPHIRFFNISGPDYYNKVRPFKKILPKELREDLEQFYIAHQISSRSIVLPPRGKGGIDTTIITPTYAAVLASWIDKKNEPYQFHDIPYKFNLLIRGSRDGLNDYREFLKRCSNKGPTLVIIKVKGSKRLLGGYNPVRWCASDGYLSSNDSFIFSFDDNEHMTKPILSRVKIPDRAIFNIEDEYLGFGSDLEWFAGICEQNDYQQKIYNGIEFIMDDYEVFQVVKY